MKKTILKQQYESFAASRPMIGFRNSSTNWKFMNVAFVSSKNTSSTNEAVNTGYDVSTSSSQGQASSSTYADDVMFSFFADQFNSPQLYNEDLEQIDTDDLEEMDLKWHVAMLTIRGNRNGDASRRIVPVETPANALVVQDGIVVMIGSFRMNKASQTLL
ncbi:hypothetical protein Tco_1331994 [Tanacetum coccineum]